MYLTSKQTYLNATLSHFYKIKGGTCTSNLWKLIIYFIIFFLSSKIKCGVKFRTCRESKALTLGCIRVTYKTCQYKMNNIISTFVLKYHQYITKVSSLYYYYFSGGSGLTNNHVKKKIDKKNVNNDYQNKTKNLKI